MQYVTYLTVYPRLLVGQLLDFYGVHDVVNTSAIPHRVYCCKHKWGNTDRDDEDTEEC